MAGDDAAVVTNTAPSHQKLVPFSIPNNIPVKLSLDKHNYNTWSSFLKINLGSLGLKAHIEGTSTSNTNP